MELPVLIEPVEGVGFRARLGDPVSASAEGPTADEAMQRLRQVFAERLAGGARLASMQVPEQRYPWLRYAGMFDEADPVFQAWQQAIQGYRDEVENDPNYL